MKTSIKIKKFWYADIASDGDVGTGWVELQIGQREATAQFNGSDADTANYKNVIGNILESSITKGDKTVNFQFADLTPATIAEFIGGTVTDDVNETKVESPENVNQSIEKSIKILTDKNVLFILPRCSMDAYPMVNDDDLHYFMVNSVVLKPTKAGVAVFSMSVLKLPSETDILTLSLPEQTGAGVPDTATHKVTIEVVNATPVTALVPTITSSLGSSLDPVSDIAQDFTSPVDYEVEAADGTTQDWEVTVTIAAP